MSAADRRPVERITMRGVHFVPFADEHGQTLAVLVGRDGHVIGHGTTLPGETTEEAAARLWTVLPTLEQAPRPAPAATRPTPTTDAAQGAMLRFFQGARRAEPN
jgi:hypothetical protein